MNTVRRTGEDNIRISDEVIAICAVNATLKTEGVADLEGDIRNTLTRNILGKDMLSKGVKVTQSNGSVEIDVHITVKYNVKIPAVAWDIQENVKKEVQSMTELTVNAVNIHVEGVEIPSQEGRTNDEK